MAVDRPNDLAYTNKEHNGKQGMQQIVLPKEPTANNNHSQPKTTSSEIGPQP